VNTKKASGGGIIFLTGENYAAGKPAQVEKQRRCFRWNIGSDGLKGNLGPGGSSDNEDEQGARKPSMIHEYFGV
jgi:hypothetical protein